MASRIKRSQFATYLNTGTIAVPVWTLMGDGITNLKESLNPKISSETYVTDNQATISVDSYAPTAPVIATAKAAETIFEYVRALRDAKAILADCETQIVNVEIFEGSTYNSYPAVLQNCAIQVDEFSGEGGVKMNQNFTIDFQGEAVAGTFNPTDLAFAPTPINTILTTMVIGSVTLTPLFSAGHAWTWYTGSVSNATTTVTMTSTLVGATIVQKNGASVVAQGNTASLSVGVNHLTISVTVGSETAIYYIDITRAAS
jgi:hypothetical protein